MTAGREDRLLRERHRSRTKGIFNHTKCCLALILSRGVLKKCKCLLNYYP